MSVLWRSFLLGLAILLPGILLGAAITYLTAGKPMIGPGSRVWRPRLRRR